MTGIFALVVVLVGKDYVFKTSAQRLVVAALVAFALAGVCALMACGLPELLGTQPGHDDCDAEYAVDGHRSQRSIGILLPGTRHGCQVFASATIGKLPGLIGPCVRNLSPLLHCRLRS